MQYIPEELAGILPIGHVTRAALQRVCVRFRTIFTPPRVSHCATDWYNLLIGSNDASMSFNGYGYIERRTTEFNVMRAKYYETEYEWRVCGCEGLRLLVEGPRMDFLIICCYGGSNSHEQMRKIMMEFFGRSLADSMFFFLVHPNQCDGKDIELYRAAKLGLVQTRATNKYTVKNLAGKYLTIHQGTLFWGDYDQIFNRVISPQKNIYAHICADVRGDAARLVDKSAEIPDSSLGLILAALSKVRNDAYDTGCKVSRRWRRVLATAKI